MESYNYGQNNMPYPGGISDTGLLIGLGVLAAAGMMAVYAITSKEERREEAESTKRSIKEIEKSVSSLTDRIARYEMEANIAAKSAQQAAQPPQSIVKYVPAPIHGMAPPAGYLPQAMPYQPYPQYPAPPDRYGYQSIY